MNETVNCPVCRETFCTKQDMSLGIYPGNEYDCARCGKFVLCGTLANGFSDSSMTLRKRAVLSHRLRRRQRPDGTPVQIYEEELWTFNLDDPLPSPKQQANSLIRWIGDHQSSPANALETLEPEVSAWIGAPITSNFRDEGLSWLLEQKQIQMLVKEYDAINRPTRRLSLTFDGWQRWEALNREELESFTAFMAMQFDSEMDSVSKTVSNRRSHGQALSSEC
jgi:hypothetical protein